MRNSVIVLLGLLCVFASAESIFAVNQQEIGIFSELQHIDGSDFGKKLLDTITLQLRNKAPLSEISSLLASIKTELVNQKNKADSDNNNAISNEIKAIREYESRIGAALTTINTETSTVTNAKAALDTAEGQKKSFEFQKKMLQDREASFRKAYKQDQEDHGKRISQQRAVISALDQIIPELERLKPHGNVQTALVELARIGRANPIGALLQVAMTLDKGALVRVIQHLQRLKKSVQASIADDDNAQRQAEANYKQMIQEFEKETNNLSEALDRTNAEIKSRKDQIANAEAKIEAAKRAQKVATEGKKQTIQARDDRTARYNAATAARNAEIDIVEKVLKIIATRLNNMQDYIAKRVNN